MRGPDSHGPTFARRLIGLVLIICCACTFVRLGLATATQATRVTQAAHATQGTHVARAMHLAQGTHVAQAMHVAQATHVAHAPHAVQAPRATREGATIDQAIAASAFAVVDLTTGRAIREQKRERLDTPVWPGSIAKLATFAAAIDAGALTATTRVMCTRHLTLAGGRRIDCSHPPSAHPLSPVEALAQSCNVFTATIARGLTREQLSNGFVRMGLGPVPSGADLIASALGLDGAKVAPRKLLEPVRRAANIPLLRDGLRASATTGTSSAFAEAGIEALAKTGTAPMRSGGRGLGLVSAVTPPDSPRFGIVVALPGGSGAQAAETAAAILRALPSSVGVLRIEAERPTLERKRADEKPRVAQEALEVTRTTWWTAPLAAPSAANADSASGPGPVASFESPSSPGGRGGWGEQGRSSQPAAVVRMRIGQPTAKGYAVETLDVEDYVARVVAGETSDATPAAAREALAITARTFAMVNRGRHAGDGFDLCTLTHCQVTRPATRSSRAAADRTRGQVLIDDRGDRDGRSARLAPVFYSASCGGTLADARSVLPNADALTMPWLASRPDPAGVEEVTWQTDISAGDLLRALQQSGSRGDTLRNLIAHASTAAGGGTGAARITGTGNGNADGRRTPTPSTPANLGRRRETEPRRAGASESSARSGSGADAGSSDSRGSNGRRGPAAAPGLGVVTHVTTEGLTPSTLSIDDFRRAIGQQLGWQLLKSPRFTVQRTSRGYRFTGRGHGHGVGLCVLGASALAARGDDAPRILQAYFPGLQTTTPNTRDMLSLLRSERAPTAIPTPPSTSTSSSTSTSAPASTPASGPTSTRTPTSLPTPLPTIQLRLPSSDEGERARLLRLIATNLRELALDLSLPSPSGLDVIVHPTVNAYRRATHSPSWTSAATVLSGDEITLHFAPLSVLDRGAMLTQTVRHELVHVLTLRALFDRPRWVHEGLALHFAGERVSAEPDETSGDDVKCPSDRDLMRPRSRDAFDRAYSRAAACVTRALASGRDWRDLGAR
jgi:stage II sporulation protein D